MPQPVAHRPEDGDMRRLPIGAHDVLLDGRRPGSMPQGKPSDAGLTRGTPCDRGMCPVQSRLCVKKVVMSRMSSAGEGVWVGTSRPCPAPLTGTTVTRTPTEPSLSANAVN